MEAPTKPLGVPLIIAPAQQAQQFEKRPVRARSAQSCARALETQQTTHSPLRSLLSDSSIFHTTSSGHLAVSRPPALFVPTFLLSSAPDPPPQAFSVWSILGNPFYMMMFLMVIMIFVVPRTMEAMDPEERKAMQEQMANGGGGLLSSILSGSFDADEYKRKIEEERALTAAKAKGGGGGASGSGGGGGASGSGGKKAN